MLKKLLQRRRAKSALKNKTLIGWNEWCELPELHIPTIKAKIDTGAKTSALHAFNIKPVKVGKKTIVHFDIYPIQRNTKIIVPCKAEAIDERSVMSSSGHKERRYVIVTSLKLGDQSWEIELTLSDRDPLMFRMLLGREALNKKIIIDPSKKLQHGTLTRKDVLKKYKNPHRKKAAC